MTSEEFRQKISGKIPAEHIYISRNTYTVKGVPIYLIYFNSRIPNARISPNTILHQHSLKVQSLVSNNVNPLDFEYPIHLEEYSGEVRPNSIILFVDLAGGYMGKPNNL